MELRIDRNELLKAVKIAIRGVSQRSTLPITRGIKLSANNGYLHLTSTDIELTIKTKVPCDIVEEGECLMGDAKLMNDIVSKLPDGEVSFKVSDNKAIIKNRGSKFTLVTDNAFDFPEAQCIENSTSFEVDTKLMLEGIKKVVVAVSNDDSRPILTGSLMEVKDGNLTLVALDGYRVAYFNKKCELDINASAVIPKIALNEIAKLLIESDIVKVTLNDKFASFQVGDTNLTTVLLQGQFFNYKDLIKVKFATQVSINTRELQHGIERATIFSKEGENNLVKLCMNDEGMILTANSQIGDIVENIKIQEHSGNLLTIAFNSKFVLEGLKSIPDENFNFCFNGPTNPAVLRGADSEEEFVYLVLPVRVSDKI